MRRITVEHFLDLVDRHFFDGNRWHRVVPNFVVQDGDPRGDGWGGPPGTIRDEINRVRYDAPVLGMALDGPDSGNSQWFINLSPQPHLDGTYTVFGRVVRGADARGARSHRSGRFDHRRSAACVDHVDLTSACVPGTGQGSFARPDPAASSSRAMS